MLLHESKSALWINSSSELLIYSLKWDNVDPVIYRFRECLNLSVMRCDYFYYAWVRLPHMSKYIEGALLRQVIADVQSISSTPPACRENVAFHVTSTKLCANRPFIHPWFCGLCSRQWATLFPDDSVFFEFLNYECPHEICADLTGLKDRMRRTRKYKTISSLIRIVIIYAILKCLYLCFERYHFIL